VSCARLKNDTLCLFGAGGELVTFFVECFFGWGVALAVEADVAALACLGGVEELGIRVVGAASTFVDLALWNTCALSIFELATDTDIVFAFILARDTGGEAVAV